MPDRNHEERFAFEAAVHNLGLARKLAPTNWSKIAAPHLGRDWPISAAPLSHFRVCFQGCSSRASYELARQLMTPLRHFQADCLLWRTTRFGL